MRFGSVNRAAGHPGQSRHMSRFTVMCLVGVKSMKGKSGGLASGARPHGPASQEAELRFDK